MLHRHIRRYYLKGGIYFVTTNVADRVQLFRRSPFVRVLEGSIWRNVAIKHCILHGYVIMPDHLHIMLQPTRETVSEVLRSIKTNASRDINAVLREESQRSIFRWQKSFHDHIIRDEEDYAMHIEYIRQNPVKAGLVKKSEEYPFLYIIKSL